MLNDVEKTAISKASLKSARLPVGKHEVDTLIRIRGTVTVGEDYKRTPTISIPMKETLALFIAYSGITRKAATDALVKAMGDAQKGEGKLKDTLPIVNDTMADVEKSVLSKLGKVVVKGAVTSKLEVDALRDLLDKVGDHEQNFNVIDGELVIV